MRIPGIGHWPGRVKPGTVSDEPISGVDLLPTLCAIVGIDRPADRVLGGASFMPVLRGEPIERSRPLYWQFNRAHSDMKVAVRYGDWSLLASLSGPGLKPGGAIDPDEMKVMKAAELVRSALYNLRADVAEKHDVRDEQREVLNRLREKIERLYLEVHDEGPEWPVWEFARFKSRHIEWIDYRKRPAKPAAGRKRAP